MARRLGPRFGLEAAFLIGVAAVAAIVELEWPAIIALMFVAWLVVAAVEVAASRRVVPASAATPEPEPAAHVQVLEPAPPVPEPAVVEEVETPEDVVPPVESEPEPEAEAEPAPEPAAEPEPEPEPEEEPPPPPPPQLALMPAPPPEPEPVPEEPEPPPTVVPLRPAAPREWNIWELERRARDRVGEDPARDEEWSYLFLYLREFASPEGTLPRDFDDLVRSSFGDLIGAGT